jgi:hypothetical protein
MKTKRFFNLPKTLFLGALAILMITSLNSCSQKIYFERSSVVPAAEGKVTLSNDKNNNYVIKIQISNLADIERLEPPKNSYVVWLETDAGQARNIGRIASTNRLNVSFETVTAFKPSKIFITAEENESTQYPGTMLVLTTNRF